MARPASAERGPKVTVELPKELLRSMKFYALQRETTLRRVIIEACEAYMAKRKGGRDAR
jgi:hypothetical protein